MEVAADEAWAQFTRLLARRLVQVEEDDSDNGLYDCSGPFSVKALDDNNIESWDDEDQMNAEMDGTKPYIQGREWEGRLVAEVSGNAFLHPAYHLDKARRRQLRDLGWSRPRDNPDRSNYWTIVEPGREVEVAEKMVRALREVFGVEHPRALEGVRFYWDEDDLIDVETRGGEGASYDIFYGDPASRVILHVPHSSRRLPEYVSGDFVLDDVELEAELDAITDADTDLIAFAAAERALLRPWIFVNRLSRLVVDPERFPDEREEMNAVGMGVVYERTTQGQVLREPTSNERAELVDRFFTPYAEGLAGLVRDRLAAVGEVTVVDVHSYPTTALPYELHGDGPRPEVCVGTDAIHTPPALRDAALMAMRGAAPIGDVGLDSPFAGCYIPLDQYGVNPAVHGVMLEFRRDVVAEHLDALVEGTAALVDAHSDTGS